MSTRKYQRTIQLKPTNAVRSRPVISRAPSASPAWAAATPPRPASDSSSRRPSEPSSARAPAAARATGTSGFVDHRDEAIDGDGRGHTSERLGGSRALWGGPVGTEGVEQAADPGGGTDAADRRRGQSTHAGFGIFGERAGQVGDRRHRTEQPEELGRDRPTGRRPTGQLFPQRRLGRRSHLEDRVRHRARRHPTGEAREQRGDGDGIADPAEGAGGDDPHGPVPVVGEKSHDLRDRRRWPGRRRAARPRGPGPPRPAGGAGRTPLDHAALPQAGR